MIAGEGEGVAELVRELLENLAWQESMAGREFEDHPIRRAIALLEKCGGAEATQDVGRHT